MNFYIKESKLTKIITIKKPKKLTQKMLMVNVCNTYNMFFTKTNKINRLRFAKSLKNLGKSLERVIKKYG